MGINTTVLSTIGVSSSLGKLIENMQDKQEQKDTNLLNPLSQSFSYFLFTDAQFTTSKQTSQDKITYAEITDGSNTFRSIKHKNPSLGVHIFDFSKNDGVSTPSPNTYFNKILIYDDELNQVGEATFTYGNRFIKMENMWLTIIVFDRRTMLGFV
jgi:hypothetical protein